MIRAQHGMDAHRVYSNPVDRSTGLICDQLVMLAGYYPVRDNSEHLRFLDNSENAVKTQIWCVVATYVLIAIVRKDDAKQLTLLSL